MSAAARASGIFVLGTPRSGTTWVANLLASHPSVASVGADVHHGVHESHLLDHTRYLMAGRMSPAEFVARYAAEDYFFLAGIAPRQFEAAALARRPDGEADAIDHFAVLMELVADRAGASRWLEKTPGHAIYAEELCRRFPDARFVVVERGFWPTVGSQLRMFPRDGVSRRHQLAEKAFRYCSDARSLTRLRRRSPHRTTVIRYERLLERPEDECRKMLLDLGLEDVRLASAYPAVSSGAGPASGRLDALVVAGVRTLTRAMPYPAVAALRVRRDRQMATAIPRHTAAQDAAVRSVSVEPGGV